MLNEEAEETSININLENPTEQAEFERRRIIKGIEQRIEQKRPELFDLFFLNSGLLVDQYPSVCASYIFLDASEVVRILGNKHPREIQEEEIQKAIDQAQFFADSDNKYFKYMIKILEHKLYPPQDISLLAPITEEIAKYVDSASVNELESACSELLQQYENDLEEYQEFYKQLYERLDMILAHSWFDRFHNDLLKSVIKKLPHRELVQIPESDVTGLTKTQKKYRAAILRQENGIQDYNKIAKQYFDMKNVIRTEKVLHKLTPSNQIEGLQYWGDEEYAFDDTFTLNITNAEDKFLPSYDAVVYKGYDWNEYNRDRYDKDHLPPQTIRGYKFTVYYPSLKNRNSYPRYRLAPELIKPDDPKPDPAYNYTVIIFETGPPYLPIAFRIVDKKWDLYRDGGCTNSFIRGQFVFQITFQASLYYRGYLPETLY